MRAAIKADEFEIRDENSSGGYAPIAKVKGDKRSTIEQAAANARLIAAAPDLLEALKDAYPYIADNALRERVGNLIADATGVQA
jgi:hypothetical protein